MSITADVVTITPAFTVGEVPAPLVFTFQDDVGAPLDLIGYSVEFHYTNSDGDEVVRTAELNDYGEDGAVKYEWVAEDLEEAGHYRAHFWVSNLNVWASSVILYRIVDPVGTAPSN